MEGKTGSGHRTWRKLAIDVAMTALFLLLMNLGATGVLWHEILGVAIVGLYAAHLALNRTWIAAVARSFGKRGAFRAKANFALDALLGAGVALATASGIAISESLFPAAAATDIALWSAIHGISAWSTLAVTVVHTALHVRWIANAMRRLVPAAGLRKAAAGATLGLIAAAMAASFSIGGATESAETTSATSGTDASRRVTTASQTTSEAADTETLQQFLSRLTCTACHRHCPLSAPKCGKGETQAQAATATYEDGLSTAFSWTL